jgi:hypothetical protein
MGRSAITGRRNPPAVARCSRSPGTSSICASAERRSSAISCASRWGSGRFAESSKLSSKARGRTAIPRRSPNTSNTLPKAIQDLGWKAQVRLCTRFRRLVARGKHPNVVVTAIARELIAFMWAIAKEVPITTAS